MANTSHHQPAQWADHDRASLFLAGWALVGADCQSTEPPAKRLIPCYHICLSLPFMDATRTTDQPWHWCCSASAQLHLRTDALLCIKTMRKNKNIITSRHTPHIQPVLYLTGTSSSSRLQKSRCTSHFIFNHSNNPLLAGWVYFGFNQLALKQRNSGYWEYLTRDCMSLQVPPSDQRRDQCHS